MKLELQNKLFEKYPDIFKLRSLPLDQSCMCFGIECGDGWYGIIDWLCSQLSKEGNVQAIQVKEKYGGLRFYVSSATEGQYKNIDSAESISYFICEHCGSPFDVSQTKGWIQTLCIKCKK